MVDPTSPADPSIAAETAAPKVDADDANGDDSVVKQAPSPASAATPPAAAEPEKPSGQTSLSDEGSGVMPSEADFDAEIAERNHRVREAQAKVREAQDELRIVSQERDDAIDAKIKCFPTPTAAQTIQMHLKREADRRANRAAHVAEVNERAGHKVLSVKSVIDAEIGNRRKVQAPIPQPPPPQ